MKKAFLQHLLTSAATALACAAILTVTPASDSPVPGNAGKEPEIEAQEKIEQDTQPGAELQNDKDFEKDKNK